MKHLKQYDKRDGLLVSSVPVGSDEYWETLRQLLPIYTTETGNQACADLRKWLESGSEFKAAGFVYRVC